MSESTTIVLQRCLNQLGQGDNAAREQLLAHAQDRLERLTRKMLQNFPGLKRWVEDQDVLQNASLRLWRALQERTPPTVRDFFGLAAGLIRRELIDLMRHHFGPQGPAANHDSVPAAPDGVGAASSYDPGRMVESLISWEKFHQAVESLPTAEREVVGLLWYHQLEQAEAAEILGVDVRTVKRWWKNARLRLHESLKGDGPRI